MLAGEEDRGSPEVRDVAGFVLAGGRSTRMGQDKARVDFDGQPLIARALEILRRAGLAPAIAGSRAGLEAYAEVVADSEPDRGPLGGLCAGLAGSTAGRVVFLSVDLPLIPSSLIEHLVHHSGVSGQRVTVASVNGFPQTFPVVLRRDVLPVLSRELAAGRAGCFSAFKQAAAELGEAITVLPVEMLVQSGQIEHPDALPPALWFLNVNSLAELERARVWNRLRA
jgi:molybdopterin-guanine dinucleotide biosynthesis protein A